MDISIVQAINYRKKGNMSKQSKIKRIVKMVRTYYKSVDKRMEKAKSDYESPCTDGCDHCCYQLISSCIPEGLVALQGVWNDPALREDFSSKLHRLTTEVGFLKNPNASNRLWFDMHMPCVFLKDHRCTIYEDRPLMCRTQMSAEKTSDKCKDVGTAQKLKLVDKRPMIEGSIHLSLDISEKFGIPWSFRPFQQSLLDAWDLYVTGIKPGDLPSHADEIESMQRWAQLELRP
jgi:Fe-S-cluster containining protein